MRISKLFIALPLATSFACGADDGSFNAEDGVFEPSAAAESTVDNADAAEVDPSIVASVDVGYGTVYFHEYQGEDGSTAIAISQLAPNTYASTPLHDTMAKHTNLEVFLTLVPDQEPPQSYLDAHPGQAAELGRETSEIREAHFDANAPIEKTSQQCKNWITPAKTSDGCSNINYTGVKESNNKTGTTSLTLSTTTKQTTTGICNDGTHNVQGRLRWAPANTESYNNPGWTPNVVPGSGWIWFGAYIAGSCSPQPPNSLCLPPNQNVKWRVEGKSMTTNSSNTYDLRGAIINSYSTIYPQPRHCVID